MVRYLHTNKALSFLVILLLLVVLASIFTLIKLNPTTAPSSKIKAITLRDAVSLAKVEALKWNPQAKLSYVGSVDNPDIGNQISGSDGKRRYWNLSFVIPNTNDHFGLTIHDGQIIQPRQTKGPSMVLDLPSNSFDSTQALEKAKALYNLKPGTGWAGGYHFDLSKSASNTTLLNVLGRDSNGAFAKVNFDVETGQVVSAIHKVSDGGGLFKQGVNQPLFYNRNLNITGSALSPNITQTKTIFVWGVQNDFKTPFIKYSRDSGVTWMDVNYRFTQVNTIKFSDQFETDNTIYIVTTDSVLRSTNRGTTWNEIYKSDTPITNSYINNNRIAILTNSGLVISTDGGQKWDNSIIPPKGSKYVLINPHGTLVVQTDQKVLKLDSGTWVDLHVPFDKQLGEPKQSGKSLIVFSADSIGILNYENENWNIVKPTFSLQNVWPSYNFEKNNQLFVLSTSGKFYKLLKGGELIEIKLPSEGTVIEVLSKDGVYFVLFPISKWENWTRGVN